MLFFKHYALFITPNNVQSPEAQYYLQYVSGLPEVYKTQGTTLDSDYR